jgi:hypothetical protein
MNLTRYSRFACALLVSWLGACAYPVAAQPPDEIPVDPRPSVVVFKLSDHEMTAFEALALRGDENAGLCVALHHFFLGLRDRERAIRWLTIAAENGNPRSMEMLASVLQASADERDRTRAEFWRARMKSVQNAGSRTQCDRTQVK